jgi:hypothetical protein
MHVFSQFSPSMETWHFMLDIARLIDQLIEHGSLIAKQSFGIIRNFANRMFEHFHNFVLKRPTQRARIQIRLLWDTS